MKKLREKVPEEEVIVIRSEDDLIKYVDSQLDKKGILNRDLETKNLECKLVVLRPFYGVLAPEGYEYPKNREKPKNLAYFEVRPDLEEFLSQKLQSQIVSH